MLIFKTNILLLNPNCNPLHPQNKLYICVNKKESFLYNRKNSLNFELLASLQQKSVLLFYPKQRDAFTVSLLLLQR